MAALRQIGCPVDNFNLRGVLMILVCFCAGMLILNVVQLRDCTVSTSVKFEDNAPCICQRELPESLAPGGARINLTGVLLTAIAHENDKLLHSLAQLLHNAPAESTRQSLDSPGYAVKDINDIDGDSVAASLSARDRTPVQLPPAVSPDSLNATFWKRNWRDTLTLDAEAKQYLDDFEGRCANGAPKWNRSGVEHVDKWGQPLPVCPCVPGTLVGRQKPDVKVVVQLSWQHMIDLTPGVSLGGHWKPRDCIARRRVAVIIPCRDREKHLRAFLAHTHPILQRQLLDYTIFVVEQTWPSIFNKASLMNAGFLEASKLYQFDCVLFHDVDLLIEDDRAVVACVDIPVHYGAHLDKWGYSVGYARIFGGAVCMTPDQFVAVNGYSNTYFGWGGEDDDMERRVRRGGFEIARPPPAVSRYSSILHDHDSTNPLNPRRASGYVSKASEAYQAEGLNTVKYYLEEIGLEPRFTWLKVRLDVTASDTRYAQEPYKYAVIRGSCPGLGFGRNPRIGHTVPEDLSFISCRHQCNIDPECRGFIYDENRDEHCRLLDRVCETGTTDYDGAAKTYLKLNGVTTDFHYTFQYGDCSGHDLLDDGLQVSLSQCIIECDARDACAGFVFGEMLWKQCWLKANRCDKLSPSAMGVRTYYRDSPSPAA